MGKQVKWVIDNLGITRKEIHVYEAKGLITKQGEKHDRLTYRVYDEEDINRLWGIKLFRNAGFDISEIKKMLDDPKTDFYKALTGKIEELEEAQEEQEQLIGFLKTIKITGRMPTVTKVGSQRFEDFSKATREQWNLFNKPDVALLAKATEEIAQTGTLDMNHMSEKTIDILLETALNVQMLQNRMPIDTLYRVLAAFMKFDHKSEAVQTVIKLLHEHLTDTNPDGSKAEIGTANQFARFSIPAFEPGSSFYLIIARNYGQEACRFIAEAMAYYGGYETLKAFYEEE